MTETATRSNTELVLAAIDAINAHDAAAVQAFWDAAGVERFPDQVCHGPAEIGAYFQALFDALPDVRLEVAATAEQGDAVFVRWHATGTHTGGQFAGLDATGKTVSVDGMDHFTVRDGRIVSNFVVFDQLEFGRQLGLMPPDGSVPDRALKAAFNGVLALKARLRR
jgi:steroid delta-isomerase-like uncharacterized protein